MTAENWEALVNPFEYKLRTRELMHGFFTDHATKLEGQRATDPVLGELWEVTRPVWEAWRGDYMAWRLASGAHQSATRALMLFRRELLVSPGGEGRSWLDAWESGLGALFAPGSAEYVRLFPKGRAGISRAGLDEVGPELVRIADCLTNFLPKLTAARDAARTQAQSYTTAGLQPPPELQQRLELAERRVEAVPGFARDLRASGEKFTKLRSEQQGREGALTRASITLRATHQQAHWRLFANLGRLIDWAVTTAGGVVLIKKAAAFFDLAMLPKRKAKKKAAA